MRLLDKIISALGKSFIHLVEGVLFKKEAAVFEAADFPWTNNLEASSPDILREYIDYSKTQDIPYFDDISTPQKTIVKKNQWQSLLLLVFQQENKWNAPHFPRTIKALHEIDGVVSAMFSILKPGTHVLPHRGLYKGLLRCHLGLIIPANANDCYLLIDGKKMTWQNGKCVLFDDTFEHEVFNNSEETRVILLIDFKRPARNKLFDSLNHLILLGLSHSPLVKELTDVR